MNNNIQKMHDFYAMKKDADIVHEEFGFFTIDLWKKQGHISDDIHPHKQLGLDDDAKLLLNGVGWTEAALEPFFDVKVLEDKGEHELVQDLTGRKVLYFKGRRDGFMPTYVEHPVKDKKTWEENIKWRLNPKSPERYKNLAEQMEKAKAFSNTGGIICQNIIGGYMFLRSLLGPEGALYMFYDDPELIHECMKTWFELADYVTSKHQEYLSLDEIFFGEDICYNNGSLISPDMIREFLFPYYQQLITNAKNRQKNKSKKLFIQIDSDGDCRNIIPLYKEIGADYFSPFEVASGCDVVEIRKKHPDILIRGGIDKRILASGKDAIDRELDRIMPFMKKHGGYIPTCDHGVPEEVSFENYMHYRKRLSEY